MRNALFRVSHGARITSGIVPAATSTITQATFCASTASTRITRITAQTATAIRSERKAASSIQNSR